MDEMFYDDFHVGQRFRSETAPMTRERILEFAAEFDPQDQHIGEAQARDSMFGKLIASGWHTASQTMRLQFDILFSRFRGGAMGAQVDSLAWTRPVLPGDVLHAEIEVIDMRPTRSRPDRGLLTLKTTTLNQKGETVMEMSAAVLVPRRFA